MRPSILRAGRIVAVCLAVAWAACVVAHLLLPTRGGEVDLGARLLCILAEAGASFTAGLLSSRDANHPRIAAMIALGGGVLALEVLHAALGGLLPGLALDTFSAGSLMVNFIVVMIPGSIGVLAGKMKGASRSL